MLVRWEDAVSGAQLLAYHFPDDCIIPAALSPGTNYTNPNDVGFGFNFEYGACTCTTVWYSMLSACAVCQGRGLAIDPLVFLARVALCALHILTCAFQMDSLLSPMRSPVHPEVGGIESGQLFV